MNKIISFDAYYDAGEEFYVSCLQFNGLFKINKKDAKAQFITKFPNESSVQQGIHRKIYCAEGTLIFVPSWGKGIHTYDLQSQQINFYPIEMQGCERIRCIDVHQAGDKLWLFYAYADNPIVIFDVKTHKVEYFEEVMKVLPAEIRESTSPVFWGCFSRNGNDVYGAIWKSAYILHVNLENMAVEIISLNGWANKLTGVVYDSGILYLTEWDEEKVKAWHLADGVGKVYRPKDDMKLDDAYHFVYTNVIAYRGQIILAPNSGRRIFSLRQEDETIIPFCDLPEEYSDFYAERKDWRRYSGYGFIDGGIRLCPVRGNMMLDINVSEQTIRGYIYPFDEKWEKEYFNQIVCPYIEEQTMKGELCDNRIVELRDFIEYITIS